MPKEIEAPEPQQQYEGYRWLGSDWGRTGNATPPRLGALAMAVTTVIVLVIAVRAVAQDARPLFIIVSFAVAALTGIAAAFYVAEARFAARAAREQEPHIVDYPDPASGE